MLICAALILLPLSVFFPLGLGAELHPRRREAGWQSFAVCWRFQLFAVVVDDDAGGGDDGLLLLGFSLPR